MKIGLDADDVLLSCNQYAIDLYNKNYEENFSIHDLKNWEGNGEIEKRKKYFRDIEFLKTQPPLEGAQELIRKLCAKHEVFIITAIPSDVTKYRADRLRELFPEVSETNYIFATRKDLVDVDILLDDGPHNILSSRAKYPILYRQPWNQGLTGMLSVNSYEEFFCLIDRIEKNSVYQMDSSIFCLVGPSGSGKTAIAQKLCENPFFERPKTYTTRPRRQNETEDAYRFVTPEVFREADLLETTAYAGHFYGTPRSEIDRIITSGKKIVFALDICGANAIRTRYPEEACLCFIKRGKKDVLNSILERNIPVEEKVRRILSIDDEYKNEMFCDRVVLNTGSLEDAIRQMIG